MEQLDRTFQMFEQLQKGMASQLARQITLLEKYEKHLNEELEDEGNQMLTWAHVAEIYRETATTIIVLYQEIVQGHKEVLQQVTGIVAAIEDNSEQLEDQKAMNSDLLDQIKQLEEKNEELQATINRMKAEKETLEYYNDGPGALPPPGKLMTGKEVYDWCVDHKNGLTQYHLLDQNGNIDLRDLPMEIPCADSETAMTIIDKKTRMPIKMNPRRKEAELLISTLGRHHWVRQEFMPITRNAYPDRKLLPALYNVCEECFKVFFARKMNGQGEPEGEKTRICHLCSDRREKIYAFNQKEPLPAQAPIDPFTGLDLQTIIESTQSPLSALVNYNLYRPEREWLIKKGYLTADGTLPTSTPHSDRVMSKVEREPLRPDKEISDARPE